MHFFSKQINNEEVPDTKELKQYKLLLVENNTKRNKSCGIYTWCGIYKLQGNYWHYDSKFIALINPDFLKIDTYEGSLNFPLNQFLKGYLVDDTAFEFYKKIKTPRDLIVFLDNLNKQ